MKLEVGLYVRYKYENCIYIGKIKFISEVMCGLDETLQIDIDNCMEEILKRDVIKASNNIIDLIEIGDYVNGYRVDCVMDGLLGFEEGQDGDWYLSNENIKSIVTKEQFESIKYSLEG